MNLINWWTEHQNMLYIFYSEQQESSPYFACDKLVEQQAQREENQALD